MIYFADSGLLVAMLDDAVQNNLRMKKIWNSCGCEVYKRKVEISTDIN